MSVLFVALPIALLLGASGLVACLYCIRGGQYDDLATPPMRILMDDPVDDADRRDAPGVPTSGVPERSQESTER